MVTLDEFKKTVYYTATKIVIPLLNIKLEKSDYMKNNKYLLSKIEKKLDELYELHKDKFNGKNLC